jgi:mycoredoxin
MPLELFVSKSCPYCAQLREELDWNGHDYLVYDVDDDTDARARLIELAGPNPMVPVLVEDGRVTQIGMSGRGCYVGSA